MWLCDDQPLLSPETAAVPGDRPPEYYVTRPGGLFPAPLPQDSEQCDRAVQMFYFLGIMLAKVLQDGRLVDLPLSRPFLKLISSASLEQPHGRSQLLRHARAVRQWRHVREPAARRVPLHVPGGLLRGQLPGGGQPVHHGPLQERRQVHRHQRRLPVLVRVRLVRRPLPDQR